jgi:PAS domain S-box-containing protein
MTKSQEELLSENEELRRSLNEAQELLRAISSGEVDALVLSGSQGDQVFTLNGADHAYRILIEAMNDGAVTIDPEGTILYCNRRFAEMIKSPLEKVIGSSFYSLVLQADQAAFRVLSQKQERGELTLEAHDESILPVYISINSVQISQSQKAFCLVVTDLTEQKHKEEIVAAEKLARSIIEQATEAVVVCDKKGKIIRFSNAVTRILGSDPLLQIFGDLFDLQLPTGEKLSPLAKALQDESLLNVEASFQRRDGVLFHLLLNAGPLKSADNRIIGSVVTLTDITDRKRMENALQKSEESYATTLASIGDAVIATNEEGRITFMNAVAEELTGWTLQMAWMKPAKTVFNIINEYTREEVEDPVTRVLDKGVIVDLANHTILIRIDGKEIAIEDSGALIRDKDGKILGVVLVFRDITERRQAESVLRASMQRFYAVLSRMYAGILLVTDKGEIESVNQAFCDLFGLNSSPEEIAGINSMEMIEKISNSYLHPGEAVARIEEIIRLGEPVKGEEVAMQGGRTCLRDFVPVYVDGKSYGRLWHHLEITERKKMEEELNESEKRFRLALKNAPITVAAQDLNLRFIWAYNQRTARPEEVIGKTDNDIFIQEDAARLIALKRRAIETGREIREQIWLTRNGKPMFLEIYLEPMRDAAGQVTSIGIATLDLTAQKVVEEELKESKNLLEQRVQERTEELNAINEELRIEIDEHERSEKALLSAKNDAEEAMKAKAAFMANMSHELRTPMNSVIGFTGLLLDENLSPEQKDYVECIRNSGEALMALINDVLDFSKMEKKKMDLELQVFDLRIIIEEALDMLAAQAAKKGLEMNYSFDRNVPEGIIGDPGKLRQVLSNLLSNAVKFTKTGEVVVDVSSDEESREIHFAVKDTGIGIHHEGMSKLFLPFSQLDMTYSRGYEGTGLGLAISKKLVELMDGRIWVESEVGNGSVFHFTISADSAPSEPKPFPSVNLEGKRVLMVVGNQTLRRILGHQAHSWGMVPMMTAKPQEIVEILQRDRDYDAVIVDVGNVDALSMITKIRGLCREVPFVALAPLGQNMPPGLFQAVLYKPLKHEQLYSVLQEVLESRKATEPVENHKTEKSYGPIRILLAEDNASNQKVTLQILNKLGYRADAVVNGREALEALERQPYDIVLMDVEMPVMNGITATRKIRERWPGKGPKIIAITAYALRGDKERCLDAGMDDYIPKPVRKGDLAGIMAKFKDIL